jgi:hypothetical protein
VEALLEAVQLGESGDDEVGNRKLGFPHYKATSNLPEQGAPWDGFGAI